MDRGRWGRRFGKPASDTVSRGSCTSGGDGDGDCGNTCSKTCSRTQHGGTRGGRRGSEAELKKHKECKAYEQRNRQGQESQLAGRARNAGEVLGVLGGQQEYEEYQGQHAALKKRVGGAPAPLCVLTCARPHAVAVRGAGTGVRLADSGRCGVVGCPC